MENEVRRPPVMIFTAVLVVLVAGAAPGLPRPWGVAAILAGAAAIGFLLFWAQRRAVMHGERFATGSPDGSHGPDHSVFELGDHVVRVGRSPATMTSDGSSPELRVDGRPATVVRTRLSRTQVHVGGHPLVSVQKMPLGMIRARAADASEWQTGPPSWVVGRIVDVNPRAGLVLTSLIETDQL